MLAEAQDGLIALIKSSPLAKKLRVIDVLPTVPIQILLQKFATDAPAIYVDAGGFGDNNGNRVVVPSMALLLIAKNARGAKDAQRGDGIMIGLLEMVDAAASLIDGANAGGINWTVDRAVPLDNFEDRPFINNGLFAMSMKVSGKACLLNPADEQNLASIEQNLADFMTMAVDYDVEPFASDAVRQGWLAEPKDTAGGTPDLQSTITLDQ
jgi:hypothetical protein